MPKLVQRLFPERIWALPNKDNKIYLTFDDGPIPEVTPWVLDTLKEYNAKATFFCIGDNVKKHPEIFQRIISEGHQVGNHTFNHLNGWKTSTQSYIENVSLFETELQAQNSRHSYLVPRTSLFRPPYGKITSKQASLLQQQGYKIVMWSVLSYDYDASVSEDQCFQNVAQNLKPGSIVVFHDSLKAQKNLRYVLPKVLEYYKKMDYNFKKL
ncbi:polysaccharide deacetylase family protein [Marixanthomonas spongiae]|uniref:Polysaccharide deacetylase family protein n=1 Tax=Marixanthomonas spongiae TaxID=2174845 RepID=A0A2U0I065_9FLAO|nr:polysaccharide deacetylase family protein [Marixanthomonas spongiae]